MLLNCFVKIDGQIIERKVRPTQPSAVEEIIVDDHVAVEYAVLRRRVRVRLGASGWTVVIP